MGLEANKAVVRRYLAEVVSTGDVSRIAEFIAPEYEEEGDTTGASRGLAGATAHVQGVRSVYPDLVVTPGRQIAEGEWVATCVTARGTHAGAWLGIAPTGRPVTFTGVNIDRVVDGRIVWHGGAANLLGQLLAVGAVAPTPPRSG